jgi:hypothetical protein
MKTQKSLVCLQKQLYLCDARLICKRSHSLFTAFRAFGLLYKHEAFLKRLRCFATSGTRSSCATFEPHPEDILSILVVTLLGDGCGEKRAGSSRFHIHMSSSNIEYLHWLHKSLANKGYCSPNPPKFHIQIGKEGRVYRSLKFRTWSFRSLNWLYDSFYDEKAIKRIPENINQLCTPRALAVWLMDDGGVSGAGVKISTESCSYFEVLRLQKMIQDKFCLETTIQRHKERWILYFQKSQVLKLSHIVKPYMIPSMHYKIHQT